MLSKSTAAVQRTPFEFVATIESVMDLKVQQVSLIAPGIKLIIHGLQFKVCRRRAMTTVASFFAAPLPACSLSTSAYATQTDKCI